MTATLSKPGTLVATSTGMKTADAPHAWLDRESMLLDWYPVERHCDARAFARERVASCQRLGIKAYTMVVQIGGTTIYPSRLADKNEAIDGDLMQALVEEHRRAGHKVIAGWNGTIPAASVQATEHPDWLRLQTSGAPQGALCLNSPWRDFQFAQVEEVVRAYDVDGIYFDQVGVGCFCQYCKAHYQQVWGEPMPVDRIESHPTNGPVLYPYPGQSEEYGVPKEICRKLQHIAEQQRVSWAWHIRQVLDRARPGLVLICNRIEQLAAEQVRPYVDALLPEVNLGQQEDLVDISAERALTGLYGRKPVHEVLKFNKDVDRPNPVVHALLHGAEIVSNGHIMTLVQLNAFTALRPGVRERVEGGIRNLAQIRARCAALRPVAYVGVLHSRATWQADAARCDESAYGATRFCAEQHLPQRLVSDEDLLDGDLDLPVLVLPESRVLEDGVAAAIYGYVERGGGLVVTGRTGEQRADGVLRQSGEVDELLGVKRLGWRVGERFAADMGGATPIQSLYPANFQWVRVADVEHPVLGDLRGALTDFNAGYVECQPREAEVLAEVLAFDQELINAKHFQRRYVSPGQPTAPFLTVRSFGKGRVAYFAPPAFAPRVRDASEDVEALLRNAIAWCGGAPPIEADGLPMTTKVSAWGGPDDGSMIVFLRGLAVGKRTFRYGMSTPASRLGVRVRERRVRACRSLVSGAEMDVAVDAGTATVSIPGFENYEAIELTF